MMEIRATSSPLAPAYPAPAGAAAPGEPKAPPMAADGVTLSVPRTPAEASLAQAVPPEVAGAPPQANAPRPASPAASAAPSVPQVLLDHAAPPPDLSCGPDLRLLLGVPSAPTQAAAPTLACTPMVTGFSPEVAALDLSGPHTIHDLEGYLADNLGAETLQQIRDGKERFVIFAGEGREVGEAIRDKGWTVLGTATKAQGFHQVLHVATETGERMQVITRVNGEDRITHLQSMLKLAGLPADRMVTTGRSHSFKNDYLERFAELGPAPDLVVYGMARTAVGALLSAHPIRNAGLLLDVFRQVHNKPVRGDESQAPRPSHDLDGLTMHTMELQDGRRAWFFPPLYGDLSRDLLEALVEHGAKDITFVGTAGATRAGFEVGQVVTPREHVRPDGTRASLDWLQPAPQATPCTYMRVATPNLETKKWADETRAKGVDMIEVELGYWLDALEKRPDVHFRVQNVLSDVMEGEGARDMTQWGRLDNFKLQRTLRHSLQAGWHMQDSDLRIRSYESVPIRRPESA